MDENLNLLLGIDGKPLPQQKDAKGINDMQVVEGSDGAQHVKITDLTGDPFDIKQSLENLNASIKANKTTPIEEINVSNFPPVQNVKNASVESKLEAIENKITNKVEITNHKETQNVKDAEVKAELELIKQSIADNKATNDLILAKLDSGVNTQLTGSNVEQDVKLKTSELGKDNAVYVSTVEEYELETLVDGEIIQPNTTAPHIFLRASNERSLYLFIAIDKPNWTLRGRTLFGRLNHETVFPVYEKHDKTYNSNEPAIAFLLGIRPTAQGLANPTNIGEAKALRMPLSSSEYVTIRNDNEEPATVTVKVLRVW